MIRILFGLLAAVVIDLAAFAAIGNAALLVYESPPLAAGIAIALMVGTWWISIATRESLAVWS